MTLLIFLCSLFGVMLLGVPISFALIISGLCLMLFLNNFDTQILASNIMQGVDSFSLLAVPFFILAGELMNAGGISKRIINFGMTIVGHIRGGLGYVAIIGCVLFAGLSGSIIADAAALGSMLIPMMKKAGYNQNYSAGLIGSGGIIAGIIPPSIPIILFGITGSVSISKLFTAGIVPGILLGISLAICWWFISRNEDGGMLERTSWKEKLIATKDAIWALGMPVIIIVGLRGGFFTPTEAGVIAVLYAFIVGLIIYRELKLKDIYEVLLSAAKTTSIVIFLIGAAMVTGWLITIANIPDQLISLLDPFMDNRIMLLIFIALFVIIIGTVMDLTPNVLILTPVLLPIVMEAGIDPVYFGIIFILANCIGLLTPPVGSVLNVVSGVGKLSMNNVIRGVVPFIIVEVCVLLLLIIFPGIIMGPLELFFSE